VLSKNIKIRIHKTIILPVVPYGCETWSLTLREENRLRVLRILRPKRDEVTGGWRKLHNEELHNFYSSPSIIRTIKSRRMTMGTECSMNGEKSNTHRILVGKPEGKRQLRRQRRRWVDDVKIDLRSDEVVWTRLI
jgi:hypothetical protein